MSYITARPQQIEIRSHWFQLLMYLVGAVACGAVSWYVANDDELTSGDFVYWMAWFGIMFCATIFLTLIWKLLNAGEIMIRLSAEGVWIKGRRNGTTIPWELVDDVFRPSGRQKQFLVLKMTDENYQRLKRGAVHTAIFHLNKLLGIQGMPLNIAGATVSHEQFESWVVGYWNDWKEQQVELSLDGKR